MNTFDKHNEIIKTLHASIILSNQNGDYALLDNMLFEVLHNLNKFTPQDIATYLRSCAVSKNRLQHWAVLLNRGIEVGKMQGVNVDDCFYGLMGYK